MTRRARSGLFLVPCSVFLFAAGPLHFASPEELIRRANAAFLEGKGPEADRLYAAAEERTADPGLVAFNRAAVLFQSGQFRDAELHYTRVLDDAACPPERAARSWYNRGTCLLRRGSSAEIYRTAIACLERCLDSPAADEPLRADARHNLELAKVLWNEARKTTPKPPTPNDNPPPEEDAGQNKRQPQSTQTQQAGTDPNQTNTGTTTQPVPQPAGGTPQKKDVKDNTNQNGPGTTNPLPPLEDKSTLQPLSPEDTREFLRRTAERLRKDRHDLWRTIYGKDRPGIRDW